MQTWQTRLSASQWGVTVTVFTHSKGQIIAETTAHLSVCPPPGHNFCITVTMCMKLWREKEKNGRQQQISGKVEHKLGPMILRH